MAVERANAGQQEASLEMQVQYLIKYYPYYEQYYQQLALQEAEKAQQAQIAQAQAQRAAQSQATVSQASEQNTPAKADKAKTAMETLQALQAQHAQQVQQPQLQQLQPMIAGVVAKGHPAAGHGELHELRRWAEEAQETAARHDRRSEALESQLEHLRRGLEDRSRDHDSSEHLAEYKRSSKATEKKLTSLQQKLEPTMQMLEDRVAQLGVAVVRVHPVLPPGALRTLVN